MKIISSIALCGMISTVVVAAPHATWQSVDGQERIVISNLPNASTPLITARNTVKSSDPFIVSDVEPSKPLSLVELAIADAKKKRLQNSNHSIQPKKNQPYKVRKTQVLPSQYVVTKGQSYMTALRQWVAKDKFTRIAWSISKSTVSALEKTSPNGEVFKGNLTEVVKQLSDKLKTPLHFTHDSMRGLAAIHTFDQNVELNWIHGTSLKDAIYNLTNDYKWNWKNDLGDQSGSWMSPDDFSLATSYPIVSPRGDFAYALNTVLEGYPVKAQLLWATRTIFVLEKR